MTWKRAEKKEKYFFFIKAMIPSKPTAVELRVSTIFLHLGGREARILFEVFNECGFFFLNVETELVKEELEWRRGVVQRARVEQWAGSGRRVGSTWCGRR